MSNKKTMLFICIYFADYRSDILEKRWTVLWLTLKPKLHEAFVVKIVVSVYNDYYFTLCRGDL